MIDMWIVGWRRPWAAQHLAAFCVWQSETYLTLIAYLDFKWRTHLMLRCLSFVNIIVIIIHHLDLWEGVGGWGGSGRQSRLIPASLLWWKLVDKRIRACVTLFKPSLEALVQDLLTYLVSRRKKRHVCCVSWWVNICERHSANYHMACQNNSNFSWPSSLITIRTTRHILFHTLSIYNAIPCIPEGPPNTTAIDTTLYIIYFMCM